MNGPTWNGDRDKLNEEALDQHRSALKWQSLAELQKSYEIHRRATGTSRRQAVQGVGYSILHRDVARDATSDAGHEGIALANSAASAATSPSGALAPHSAREYPQG